MGTNDDAGVSRRSPEEQLYMDPYFPTYWNFSARIEVSGRVRLDKVASGRMRSGEVGSGGISCVKKWWRKGSLGIASLKVGVCPCQGCSASSHEVLEDQRLLGEYGDIRFSTTTVPTSTSSSDASCVGSLTFPPLGFHQVVIAVNCHRWAMASGSSRGQLQILVPFFGGKDDVAAVLLALAIVKGDTSADLVILSFIEPPKAPGATSSSPNGVHERDPAQVADVEVRWRLQLLYRC